MTRTRLRFAALCTLTALVGLTAVGDLAAQRREDDPRFVPDPRDLADPRDVLDDPRVVELDPQALPTGRELFDYLLEAGDDGRLRVAMVENPWIVLGYIDQVCNRRLVMTEAGAATQPGGMEEAADLESLALRLATLADGGLRDSRFVAYVTARLAWDTEELVRWREREVQYQEALVIYGQARAPSELHRALTPLRQSLETARVLGDVTGQTRCMALIGRIQADLGSPGEAGTMMREVLRLGRPVRDFDSVWEALSVLYETLIAEQRYQEARVVLRDQYLVAQDTGDQAAAEGVLAQLLGLEDFLRRKR